MLKIRLHQLQVPLDYTENDIIPLVAQKLNCAPHLLHNPVVRKRSIDARARHSGPLFTLSVDIEFQGENLPGKFKPNEVQILTESVTDYTLRKIENSTLSPVIVGAGPAGLLAGLALAQSGLKPVILERGAAVDERATHVEQFWARDELNTESNVLYGEGGAGLFSDGKLTARTKDKPRTRYLLHALVDNGAPADILIDGEPHVGTDLLTQIVPNMRKQIEMLGGQFRFNACLSGLHIENEQLVGIEINNDEHIETGHCILATGHSARDIYDLLLTNKVPLQSKPLAIGVRLEIPQVKINRAQWGKFAGHPQLGAASYRLTRKSEKTARACYSFCMCPGGTVISCASSQGALTTNGMSSSSRSGEYANAAFLVPVNPQDFQQNEQDIAAGYLYQLEIEQKAWQIDNNYHIPASTLSDFLNKSTPHSIPDGRSWHFAKAANLHNVLPPLITDTLHLQIPNMLRELNGVTYDDVLLYGPETRSSSPVRIVRDETGQSTKVKGIFPAGEGAGYAGGIVSSAIDGIKAAEAVIATFKD